MKVKGKNKSALSNPVLGEVEKALVTTTGAVVLEAAPGLNVVQLGDRITLPGLEKFPLGSTRAGKWSGTLMNISAYCRMKTGRAWNDGHAKTVKKNEGITLHVLKDEKDKKTLSAELDAFRPAFAVALKGMSAVINSRPDAQVTKLRVRRTAKGVAFDQTTLIKAESESARMAAELAKQQQHIAALEAAMPKELLKKIRQAEAAHPIDVTSTQAPIAPAPVPETPPIDIPAAPAPVAQ